MVLEGSTAASAAKAIGRSCQTVCRWVQSVDEGGLAALRQKPYPGKARLLDASQEDSLKDVLLSPASDHGYDIWDAKTVASFVEDRLGVRISVRTANRYIHRAGFSYGRPDIRPCRKEDSETREAFKKN